MSSVVISGDTSGAITLAAPAVSGTNTATLPAATGTVMVSGNMPAFSAYGNANYTQTSGVWTKLQANTKEFDTASCFNTSTYAFTPNVAGYYQVTSQVTLSTSVSYSLAITAIYKNGSQFKDGNDIRGVTGTTVRLINSALIYMNGTTDYLEIYARMDGTGTITSVCNSADGYFQAVLVRGA
jgi:hypothetical protein